MSIFKGKAKLSYDMLSNVYEDCWDVIVSEFIIGGKPFICAYHVEMFHIANFNNYLMPKLTDLANENFINYFPGLIQNLDDLSVESLNLKVFSGNMVLFDKQENTCYTVIIDDMPRRTPEESTVEPITIGGGRDGFTENSKINMALIRDKLKSNRLKSIKVELGKTTKQEITLLYLEDKVDKRLLTRVKSLISSYSGEELLGIEQLLTNTNTNRLPLIESYKQVGYADQVAFMLLDKRIVLLQQGHPNAYVIPANLTLGFSVRDEYLMPYYGVILFKTLNIFSLLIALFLLPLYSSIIMYHFNNVSLLFTSNIILSRQGVIFSLPMEIFFTLFIFEFSNLIFMKIPKNITSFLLLLSGFILSQNAITYGLVSGQTMLIAAITVLSTFLISYNSSLIYSIIFFRWILLITTFYFGIYGFTLCTMFICVYAMNVRPFGNHFTSPILPLNLKELFKVFSPRHIHNLTQKFKNKL